MHFVEMYFYSLLLITNMFQSYPQQSSGCLKEY